MKRLKIGVIGCGAIAQVQHMPNLANLPDLFEVTMVCDLSLKAAEYVASKFKVPSFTTNYFELLESDVDAVLHCAGGHKPTAAIAAFEAGKHVFVEKPIGNHQEIEDLFGLAKGHDKILFVGYQKIRLHFLINTP